MHKTEHGLWADYSKKLMKQKINLPTKITIARIILATLLLLFIFVFYLLDQFGVVDVSSYDISLSSNGATINLINIYILVVFAIASFTDFLDGYIARKYNLTTDLGKFLDPIADKMLINGLMIFLALNFVSLSNNLTFPFFLVIIMIVRDLIVDGLRLMAARKNVVIAANIFGKLKTVTQMAAVIFVLLNGWPFSYFDASWPTYLHITDFICYLATIISVLSGIIYIKENIQVLFDNNENEKE